MRIKFKKSDPRAGMVAEMDSSRGQQLIDAGCAVRVKDNGAEDEVEKPEVVMTATNPQPDQTHPDPEQPATEPGTPASPTPPAKDDEGDADGEEPARVVPVEPAAPDVQPDAKAQAADAKAAKAKPAKGR